MVYAMVYAHRFKGPVFDCCPAFTPQRHQVAGIPSPVLLRVQPVSMHPAQGCLDVRVGVLSIQVMQGHLASHPKLVKLFTHKGLNHLAVLLRAKLPWK